MGDDDQDLKGRVDGGLRFLHILGMQTRNELFTSRVQLLALLEELVASGAVDPDALEARSSEIAARERARVQPQAQVQVAPEGDKYALVNLPVIDCATRLSLCKARCCTMTFPLSFQDINERVVEWEYYRPYQIRQRADGYCCHSDSETRACRVYDQRPATCRLYDCRHDRRIWLDFERRIPALDELVPPTGRREP